jgi:hypothetical protein
MNEASVIPMQKEEQRSRVQFYRVFVLTAGAILPLTGVAKMWSAFSGTKLLLVADPILGIQIRHLMLAVGIAELVIAAVCLLSKTSRLAMVLVAWLATNFLVYRVGLWWIGWKKPCGCLGNLTDALHISPQTADSIMKGLLVYLLLPSYALLIRQWRLSKAMRIGTRSNG